MIDDEVHFKADPTSLQSILAQDSVSSRPSNVSFLDTTQSRDSLLFSGASRVKSMSVQAVPQSGRLTSIAPPIHPIQPHRFSFSANSSFLAS
jgi:hypothetical protein